jgi:hypothetical protein
VVVNDHVNFVHDQVPDVCVVTVVEWNPGLVDALVKDHDRALVSFDCHADEKVGLAGPRRGPLSNDEFVQFRPATLLEEDPSLRRTLRKSSAAPGRFQPTRL